MAKKNWRKGNKLNSQMTPDNSRSRTTRASGGGQHIKCPPGHMWDGAQCVPAFMGVERQWCQDDTLPCADGFFGYQSGEDTDYYYYKALGVCCNVSEDCPGPLYEEAWDDYVEGQSSVYWNYCRTTSWWYGETNFPHLGFQGCCAKAKWTDSETVMRGRRKSANNLRRRKRGRGRTTRRASGGGRSSGGAPHINCPTGQMWNGSQCVNATVGSARQWCEQSSLICASGIYENPNMNEWGEGASSLSMTVPGACCNQNSDCPYPTYQDYQENESLNYYNVCHPGQETDYSPYYELGFSGCCKRIATPENVARRRNSASNLRNRRGGRGTTRSSGVRPHRKCPPGQIFQNGQCVPAFANALTCTKDVTQCWYPADWHDCGECGWDAEEGEYCACDTCTLTLTGQKPYHNPSHPDCCVNDIQQEYIWDDAGFTGDACNYDGPWQQDPCRGMNGGSGGSCHMGYGCCYYEGGQLQEI